MYLGSRTKILGQRKILRANNLRIAALGHLQVSVLQRASVYLALSDASNVLRKLAKKPKSLKSSRCCVLLPKWSTRRRNLEPSYPKCGFLPPVIL